MELNHYKFTCNNIMNYLTIRRQVGIEANATV
jgi:hypothetical protein